MNSRKLIIGIIVIIVIAGYFVITKTQIAKKIEVATQLNEPPITWIFFTTSVDKAPYGNYSFKYPMELILRQDKLLKDAAGEKHHFVLLEAAQASLGRVEINSPTSTCKDYQKCAEISGVAIGSTSANHDFIRLYDMVVENFQVLK